MALNASERNIFADGILRCFGEDAHTAGRFLRFLNDVAGVSLLTNVQSRAAVYQPFILVMQLVTIVCLQAARDTRLVDGLGFVPFALLGGIAGFAIYQRLTHKQFHSTVSALLLVSGLGLLGRSL